MIAARLSTHKSSRERDDAPAGTNSMTSRSIALRLALCAMSAAALPSERANAQADDFYAGRTISIVVSGGAARATRLYPDTRPAAKPRLRLSGEDLAAVVENVA